MPCALYHMLLAVVKGGKTLFGNSPNVRVDRLDCMDIISKCSRAAQFSCRLAPLSLSSAPDPGLSGCCTGSFLTLSFFVLMHIGDRHVFYLLLVYFCTFSVQTQPHYCVLEKKISDHLCLIITSLAPSCNIRKRYSRVLSCFIVLALRPLPRCT